MSLTIQPLTASVVIKTPLGTTWTNATATAGTNEFNLIRAAVELASSGKNARAEFFIEDNTDTLFSTLVLGSSVAINLSKINVAGSVTSVFLGRVLDATQEREMNAASILHLEADDLSDTLMNFTVIKYEEHQKRDPTTGQLNQADASNHYVTNIITRIVNTSDPKVYINGVNSGIVAGLSTAGGRITPALTSIPDADYEYKPLHDVLKELFDYLRYDWGVDDDGVLWGRPYETATDSGINILSTTNLMTMNVHDSIQETKNQIIVIGADEMKALNGTTTGLTFNSRNNSSVFLAQKFIAQSDNLAFVQFYIDKVGSPTNLYVSLLTDSSGLPADTAIHFGSLESTVAPPTGAPDWRQFEVSKQVTNGTAYWIVLSRTGGNDTTNYYRWWTNGGSNATTATATDPLATAGLGGWSSFAATSTYGHNVWYASPALGFDQDKASTSSYGIRQIAERVSEINKQDMAQAWAAAMKRTRAKKKRTLDMTVFVPDTILIPGRLVTVGDDSIVTTTYLMTDVSYDLVGREAYSITVKAFKYV